MMQRIGFAACTPTRLNLALGHEIDIGSFFYYEGRENLRWYTTHGKFVGGLGRAEGENGEREAVAEGRPPSLVLSLKDEESAPIQFLGRETCVTVRVWDQGGKDHRLVGVHLLSVILPLRR